MRVVSHYPVGDCRLHCRFLWKPCLSFGAVDETPVKRGPGAKRLRSVSPVVGSNQRCTGFPGPDGSAFGGMKRKGNVFNSKGAMP